MPIRDVFVLLFVAIYIGWIVIAAVRSNRRHGAAAMHGSQEDPTGVADGTSSALRR